MSVNYTSVQWNRHKLVYDAVLAGGVLLAVAGFAAASLAFHPAITAESLILRSTALAGILLLHAILSIGPLARLDRRFLPLLYNRRHLGVVMFLLAFVHAAFAVFQFHAFGDTAPPVSALTAYGRDYRLLDAGAWNLAHFPFEVFGAVALAILFLMAATSHDFWNKQLGPSFWKSLHLGVLAAYALLLLHVAYGVLQAETSPVYLLLLGAAAGGLLALHLAAAFRERRLDRARGRLAAEGFARACRAEEVAEGCGKVVVVEGERLAVFRHRGRLFAVSNLCRHQGGPLGEGRIVDGCVTCPWHGWQYRPEDGCSPPPFTEVVETYRLKVVDGEVWLDPKPQPLETVNEGVDPGGQAAETEKPRRGTTGEFYVGYLGMPAGLGRFVKRLAVGLLVAVPAVAALIAWAQKDFESGAFEFGVVRSFEGVLYETPLPMLRLTEPAAGAPAAANLLVVGFGKQGLPEVARGHQGEKVRFDGSLVYRQGLTMVELGDDASFESLGAPGPGEVRGPAEALGRVGLTGELVDTKCFFGVMRPATGKVHRACAVRCLSGGIPPGLLVRGEDGTGTVYLLAGPEGEALDFDVQWAGREIAVTGGLELHDEVPVLRVESMILVRPNHEPHGG